MLTLCDALEDLLRQVPNTRRFGAAVVIGKGDNYLDLRLAVSAISHQYDRLAVTHFKGGQKSNDWSLDLRAPRYRPPDKTDGPATYFWAVNGSWYAYRPLTAVVAKEVETLVAFLGIK